MLYENNIFSKKFETNQLLKICLFLKVWTLKFWSSSNWFTVSVRTLGLTKLAVCQNMAYPRNTRVSRDLQYRSNQKPHWRIPHSERVQVIKWSTGFGAREWPDKRHPSRTTNGGLKQTINTDLDLHSESACPDVRWSRALGGTCVGISMRRVRNFAEMMNVWMELVDCRVCTNSLECQKVSYWIICE